MKKKVSLILAFTLAVAFCTNSWNATDLVDNNTLSVYNRNMNSMNPPNTPQQNMTSNKQGFPSSSTGQNTPSQNQANMNPAGRNVSIDPINQVEVGDNLKLEEVYSDLDIDSDDPGVKSQYYLASTNSYLVWDYIEDEQDETVYVAVLDTGVDYDHEDLENRVDEDEGYDFVNNDGDPMDDNGHGTHVAGIIAAEMDNGKGIVGVTGNLDVVIIPIKVLDADGTGEIDDVIDGIEYAIDLGVDIINLSFGSTDDEDEDELEDAIEDAIDEGIFIVAAAGNDSTDCDTYIPTSFDDVYTVGASSMTNLPASFTNYGDCLNLLAPGEKILSTTMNDSYEAWDGTSMAAPIVSGIAAMMLAYDEDLSVDELTDLLNDTGNYLDAYEGYENGDAIGYGIIDAAGAYEDLTGEDIYEEDDFEEALEPSQINTRSSQASGRR